VKDEFDAIFNGGHIDVEPTELNEIVTDVETIDPVETDVLEEPKIEPETPDNVDEDSTDDSPSRMVPQKALHESREKFKDANRRAEEAERQLAEYRNQQATQAQPVPVLPDPYDDPTGYQAAIDAKIDARFTTEKLARSKISAVEKFGEETTNTALNWAISRATSDPTFEKIAIANLDPVAWVIDQHKRHTELNDFETDREAFIRREAAKLGIGTTINSDVVPTIKPDGIKNTAPRSLANVNSATKHMKEPDDVEDFDSIFNQKR
jgi:hypothetical protein